MKIEVTPTGSRITLPSGHIVLGEPHDTDAYRATARELGYDGDTLSMCRDHDPLHCLLVRWVGLEISYGMLDAAGLLDPGDRDKAVAEENAVCAVQFFMRLAGGRMPEGDR